MIELLALGLVFAGCVAAIASPILICRKLDRIETRLSNIKLVALCTDDDPDDDEPNECKPAPAPEKIVAFGRAA